jgi:transcription factor MBP1
MHEDDTPDNLTVASASYMAEDDRHDGSNFSGAGHRKRKREDIIQDMTEQQHAVYGDELLDYFILSQNAQPAIRPDPPTNFQPNWPIDVQSHTALHWAAAMADVDVIKQLKRFGASLTVQNERGETPFMRAVNFTNGYEKQTFPAVMKELFDTIDARDRTGCTVIHHAAVMKSGAINSPSVARYYLDNILNRLQESHDRQFAQKLVDAQDVDGNTAIHLAAQRGASKCIRALLGRGASTDIPNRDGVCAEDLIKELNATKKPRTGTAGGTARSSSPFAPDSSRHAAFRDALTDPPKLPAFESDAATTVTSRITPLVSEKFAALAASYEEEWKEKSEAEKEARRALTLTQSELASVKAQVAELEKQLEQDETAAAKLVTEAALAQTQVLGMVTHRNRVAVQAAVDAELAMSMNGDEVGDPDERLRLATELRGLLLEQRLAEADYVGAMSQVGTGDKIDRYRRLLKSCLGPEAESLEDNVDDMLAMMEEEASDVRRNGSALEAVA